MINKAGHKNQKLFSNLGAATNRDHRREVHQKDTINKLNFNRKNKIFHPCSVITCLQNHQKPRSRVQLSSWYEKKKKWKKELKNLRARNYNHQNLAEYLKGSKKPCLVKQKKAPIDQEADRINFDLPAKNTAGGSTMSHGWPRSAWSVTSPQSSAHSRPSNWPHREPDRVTSNAVRNSQTPKRKI